jgi:CBS domain-containing protein
MSEDMSFIPADTAVIDAWQWALHHDSAAYLVGTRDHLVGLVTHQQLDRWRSSDQASGPIAAVVEEPFVHAHPDHPIDVVLDRLSESGGLLPVVSRTEVHRVVGIVTPESVLPLRKRSRRTEMSETHG